MQDSLEARIARFERTVATCLSAMPVLFCLQILGVGLIMPVFESMFADFGSPFPSLTQSALSLRPLWLVAGVLVPVASVVLARRASPIVSVISSTVLALGMFVLAQLLVAALFLPILQLGQVSGK